MNLTQYLSIRGFHNFEGYSQQVSSQVEDLKKLTTQPYIKVMEIGFNAGHSAEVFLENNPTLNLVSFDLGVHDYTKVGKEYIDQRFPNRHKLIIGDSLLTVPKFIQENPHIRFDVIFIDGGHDYHIANGDLYNCRKLAHPHTVVILDDTMYNKLWTASWNVGPTKAWQDHLYYNFVHETARKEYGPGRGMTWGKYNTT